MSSSRFEDYLSKVTAKVKSKEAHSMIKKELHNHMEELSQSFQKRGLSVKDADKKAMLEMGDPSTVGRNMNHLHKPRIDWLLIGLFVIFSGISFLPLIGDVHHAFMNKQLVWLVLAIIVLVGFRFFDYRKLKNLWMYFYGGGLLLLFATFLVGIEVNGVKKWLSVGSMTIDGPALSLFLFFIGWAGLLAKFHGFKGWKKQGLFLFLFWTPALLYFMVPQIMFSIIYVFCVLAMFVSSYVHKKFAIKVAVGHLLIGILFISLMVLRIPRSDTFFPLKGILSEAGWFGTGLYNDLMLPEAHTDFAFPFLVHSLGWVFGISLCLLLFVFILRISLNALKTKDLFGRLLAIGGSALFIVPACWNILMGFGVVPIMDVPLPFISYGGSMLLVYSALLGLILSVYRRKDIVEPTVN